MQQQVAWPHLFQITSTFTDGNILDNSYYISCISRSESTELLLLFKFFFLKLANMLSHSGKSGKYFTNYVVGILQNISISVFKWKKSEKKIKNVVF